MMKLKHIRKLKGRSLTAYVLILATLTGCSSLGGLALDALSPSDGVTATAQVGEENQSGLANASIDSGDEVSTVLELDEVQGDATVDASQIWETNINMPTYVVILIALGFWMIRTPTGMFFDFMRARRRFNKEK